MVEILDILPRPFEWLEVPNGVKNLGKTPYSQGAEVKIVIHRFCMAKYPITNAQYLIYANDTGKLPRHKVARDSLSSDPFFPVAYLLWTEAMDYCDWLSEKLGYLVKLPTDAQWQLAAQGSGSRRYPWGDFWDADRCNSKAAGIGQLTCVQQYPTGASPYGIMDMLGNTVEWCLTDGKTGENNLAYNFEESDYLEITRIAKGSHYDSSVISTNIVDNHAMPINFSYVTGIRLVTDKPLH